MAKPTYMDIAREASVGTATVERVLNGRGGVREDTAERVLLAARRLDWPGRLPERHRGVVRIEVILVRPDTSFLQRLAKAFRRIASTLDQSVQIQITTLNERDPARISEHVARPPYRRSGLVVYAPADASLRAALDAVHCGGTPVVQVVTRASDTGDFVGIDNVAVGRTAGLMMARLGPASGQVVAVCHSSVYHVHRQRISGFSDFLESDTRHGLSFDHIVFGLDDRNTTEVRLIAAARQMPDLVGVYNAGGANMGVLRALEHLQRDVFFVGHELNEVTKAGLQDGRAGVIFDQLPEAQARRAVDLLLWRIGLVSEPVDNPPIRFTTVTRENV